MTASTEPKIRIEAIQMIRKGICAMTNDTIDPGEKCSWVEGYGCFRQDITEDDIREFIAGEES